MMESRIMKEIWASLRFNRRNTQHTKPMIHMILDNEYKSWWGMRRWDLWCKTSVLTSIIRVVHLGISRSYRADSLIVVLFRSLKGCWRLGVIRWTGSQTPNRIQDMVPTAKMSLKQERKDFHNKKYGFDWVATTLKRTTLPLNSDNENTKFGRK